MRYITDLSGVEPITMPEIKAHLRVSYDDEDALILSMLGAAREYVEKLTSQAVMPQTVKAYYSALPHVSGFISLPLSNAVSITSVKYLDGAGVQQTVPSGDYYLTVGQPNRVYFNKGFSGAMSQPDSVEIVYEAGYGAAPYLPLSQTVKAAIMVLTADMYEHREAQSNYKFEQNQTAERLLGQGRELGL